MPNQLNFPDKIKNTEFQRPSRIKKSEVALIVSSSNQILYGTREKDNVEVWVYNTDGSYAGHTLIRPSDGIMNLTTIVDQTGPYEMLNIDIRAAAVEMGLSPGRYAVEMNFFRDEVGAEDDYKLLIMDISSDRTEVKLSLLEPDERQIKDIFEFIVPSAPKKFIQALIDQTFGFSLDALENEKITTDKTLQQLNSYTQNTESRINKIMAVNNFDHMVKTVIIRARKAVLDKMAEKTNDFAIQEVELMNFIQQSINEVIYDMKLKGEIDFRFVVE